jgi:dihydroflavonol-4-reductase
MRALVTGSTGFIGSHLCRALLTQGYKVRAFQRTTSSQLLIADLEVEPAIGDLTQPETITAAMQDVDIVFHTASKVDYWREQNGMYPVTVRGTQNVLQAALQNGVKRVVYTSSVAALGVPDLPGFAQKNVAQGKYENPAGLINETHTWNYHPEWWRYGHAKHMAEREVQTAVAQGLDAVIVNPSMVLGPGDVNRISGEVVVQVAKKIIKFGIPGGMNGIHVADAVRGHMDAMERGKTGERYILGGENLSYFDLITRTAKILGVAPPLANLPAALLRPLATPLDWICRLTPMPFNGDILRFAGQNMFYDTKKAQRELGFRAEKSIEIALGDTYEWYRKNGIIG